MAFTLLVGATSAFADQTRVIREVPENSRPGDIVAVSILVQSDSAIRIVEDPPEGWEVLRADPPPTESLSGDGSLAWELDPRAEDSNGISLLSYVLLVPEVGRSDGTFEGRFEIPSGSFETPGDTHLRVGWTFTFLGFDIVPWEVIGILGTFVFASRFMVQWIASERRRRSVVPVAFWWISLIGAATLLAYGIHFRRFAVVLGQSFGFVVYIRNLMLIRRHERGRELGEAVSEEA